MDLHGCSLIGLSISDAGDDTFTATDPASGLALEPLFHVARPVDVDRAVELAADAFATYRMWSGPEKALLLRKIAERLDGIVDELVVRVAAETGLPEPRIRMETGRTTGQLRMFADLVEDGAWVTPRIETADPDRQPLPKPDLRSMLRPLGPVAVFGASNFPLAYSVAGGDTAAALAAGCPVIVKAHFAHPGTSEIVGRAVVDAVSSCDAPDGVFSMLHDSGHEVGVRLVQHPRLAAVGFTGSRVGGRALLDLASARPEPIPVFAEMSSVNPILVLPSVLDADADAFAEALHGSVTLGVGQFCTNPGLVLAPEGAGFDRLTQRLAALVADTQPASMLHAGIASAYAKGVEQRRAHARVIGEAPAGDEPCDARAIVFATTAKEFTAEPKLADELFGPTTLLVSYRDDDEMVAIARAIEGQLTASFHGSETERESHADLVETLTVRAGRVLFNQFPTGVEVCGAMVHGGPYPATSDGRSTSVGTAAITRFARPVCYQNFPDGALPGELRRGNPLGLTRVVDGRAS